MERYFQAFILGLVQGATEYIPVSSKTHLIIVPWFLGWPEPTFAFNVLVQWGTLVGVFIFFWQDIWDIVSEVVNGILERDLVGTFDAKLGWMIVVATIPAGVIGLLFEEPFKYLYQSPPLAGGLLLVTAIMLVVAESYSSHDRDIESIDWLDAVIIGFWQALAILPGVSRSGSTISGAVTRDISRTAAARFSFLMSIPALLGAGLVALKDLVQEGNFWVELPFITVGFIAAAFSGYLCIRWLLRYLQTNRLYVFSIYCVIVSMLSITKWLLF